MWLFYYLVKCKAELEEDARRLADELEDMIQERSTDFEKQRYDQQTIEDLRDSKGNFQMIVLNKSDKHKHHAGKLEDRRRDSSGR